MSSEEGRMTASFTLVDDQVEALVRDKLHVPCVHHGVCIWVL